MLSNDHIANMTDHLQQAVLAIDQKGLIVYCNDSASQFWQRDTDRLIGRKNNELFQADVMIQHKIREVLDSGKVCRLGGYVLQTPPLRERGAEIVIAPVRLKSGRIEQAVITLLESTTIQESQARELEEQLASSIGKLAGTLAHEIQNPLSGVKGMLQLLQRDLQNTKFKNGSISMMLEELDRVERLLKQLLFHSHPIPLETSAFNIHELLNTVIRFENNTADGIRFKRSFDTSLPEIQSDRDKLHQVFLNLIRNAVEASPADTSVTVSTRFCGRWELAGTNLDPELNYTLIAIEDEGNGIPTEIRDQLFKPLFTTKKEGHGLGLSISHRLVQALGGLLRFSPSNSAGSTFQVFLPDSPPENPV
ncbi:MAG: Signal transduction histidine-protein kinase AtoS [Deltaproteobacteria bacterium]|nr:Signal transduction histidine-protein kinase AtoS [Deltaproteobacteria bacterium]